MMPWSGNQPAMQLAHPALDGLIDVGDQRCVGLGLHREAALEGRHDDPPRLVGQLERPVVIALDVSLRVSAPKAQP